MAESVTVLQDAGDEPGEASDGHSAHGHGESHSLPVDSGQGTTAGGVVPFGEVRVGTPQVHVELKLVGDREVARAGSGSDVGLDVLDDESELVGQKGVRVAVLLTGIPEDVDLGAEGHVLRKGPGGGSTGAANEDVDGRWFGDDVGVVPTEGDPVADHVQL